MDQKKITIYSTPMCVYCRLAKDFFKKHNLQYTEIDVLRDMKAREEMFAKSKQMGVPVIDIDGEIFVGFDKGSLEKILGVRQM
ncbi:MAG: NrdH-redoxin [Candidatus Liptonbacteria bacterium RIFOXYC1_FULL_36_8]|uniref:NrdH-redoxin n=3 Tax=Parcubacteria group TaxID=1794811 RepID=A0A1G2CNJ5_9BACT|nr:MAG: NrdH-redoxin [Candidatus Harrisonbacteria bacterium RIFCSPLOWO2_01_FULL_40_28]OGY69219.1 MAG: NrdH-redoxin [Candidatus Harrisonbacteria bacterium RIFOXYD1_FULL_40_9]OGZ02986.1 MAG: NrdH-redoxin [Candidatus Liptonbacteria bacterium RIFOXYC1_FULL_36_8]